MSLPGNVVVEAGPFNGPDDADASMLWLDISDRRIRIAQQPATAGSGRQTDLQSVDPGPFTITLNNHRPSFAIPPVTGGTGSQSLAAVNVKQTTALGYTATDFDITVEGLTLSALPTGAPCDIAVVARYVDDSNLVDARVFATTGNTVSMALRQIVGGVETFVGFPTLAGATATSAVSVRLLALGPFLGMKVWLTGTTQPSAWSLSMTTTWVVRGSSLLTSILEAGNTNTLPVGLSWSTTYAGDPLSVSDLFTPNNVLSPLCPGWRTGMRLRMRETVGYRTFTLADGNMLQPAVTIQTPGADQTVSVTAVDRIGRLQQGRKFISTLAEHILYNAVGLAAYFPLNDGGRPPYLTTGQNAGVLTARLTLHPTATSGAAQITPRAGSVAPGDDLQVAGFGIATDGAATVSGYQLYCTSFSPQITLSAGQVLTAVMWLAPSLVLPASLYEVFSLDLLENAGQSHLAIWYDTSVISTGLWGADIGLGGLSATVTNSGVALNTPVQVAVRYGYNPAVFEFWIGSQRATATLTGTPPTSTTVIQMNAPPFTYAGLLGHLQLYVGAASDWDFTAFRAQGTVGRSGLAGQYTGDRVRTILRYAGVPAGELGDIDTGTSTMSPASLAGRTALDVIREAETTEQGLFHARGRHPVFHARTRRYNR